MCWIYVSVFWGLYAPFRAKRDIMYYLFREVGECFHSHQMQNEIVTKYKMNHLQVHLQVRLQSLICKTYNETSVFSIMTKDLYIQ